jgi:hypothetical protein
MRAMCTRESHADLKRDPRRWASEVDPIGEIVAGDGSVFVLANCRACQSTLAVCIADAKRPADVV